MSDFLTYKPIGIFSCSQVSPVESPRQGVLAKESQGFIQLNSDIDQKSLEDLLGFQRIWLLYDFHKNKNWSPMVRPPRGADKKRGVFATRSPYRPNSIGMSCVLLGSIKERVIEVFEHDLLDQTPILDLKPYLPYSDSFNDSRIGWLEDVKKHQVLFTNQALEQLNWLSQKLNINIENIIQNQLEYDPTNKKIKRVRSDENHFVFSYKTWRVNFTLLDDVVSIFQVESGYSKAELDDDKDLYQDKAIHRLYQTQTF